MRLPLRFPACGSRFQACGSRLHTTYFRRPEQCATYSHRPATLSGEVDIPNVSNHFTHECEQMTHGHSRAENKVKALQSEVESLNTEQSQVL